MFEQAAATTTLWKSKLFPLWDSKTKEWMHHDYCALQTFASSFVCIRQISGSGYVAWYIILLTFCSFIWVSLLFSVLTKWLQMRTCRRICWTILTSVWTTAPAFRATWLQLQGSLTVVRVHSSVSLSIFLDWVVDPSSSPN
jgi:hypothetical protein